jgi:hypothetical protein
MFAVEPVALVNAPLDGEEQFTYLNAPATGQIHLHQIVKNVDGVATPVDSADTTGFYLAVSDTSPTQAAHGGTEGPGGTVGAGIGDWVAKRPAKVRVIDLTGRKVIVSVSGTLDPSHIGTRKTFTQSGPYTVLDLNSTPASGGALILELVGGGFGLPNSRVLVQL